MTPPAKIDTFVCVHRRDIDYLLETGLRAMLRNFGPRGSTMLVTNDVPALSRAVESWGLEQEFEISDDADWLSKKELSLPGWYKQQIIKLRSAEFCSTENFCNIGADTVIVRPITAGDLVDGGKPVVYYTRHVPRNVHWIYERIRVHHVGRILKVRPRRAAKYVDFINDVFCFNREDLQELNARLRSIHGPEPLYTVLEDFGNDPRNEKKFGEWTLYDTFVLDALRSDAEVRDMAAGFLTQVRTPEAVRTFAFDSKAVHFVSKDLDVSAIAQRIEADGSDSKS